MPPCRIIVTTDPELDDLNPMLRLLLYRNELDIAALAYSASNVITVGTGPVDARPPVAFYEPIIDERAFLPVYGCSGAPLRPTSVIDFVEALRDHSRMSDKSDTEQIDDIIANESAWKRDVLIALRAAIRSADPAVIEVVKYKKPSKPEGVPFWTHDGDVCYVDVLKNAVRLNFSKGARMKSNRLFNSRLDSKVIRAIDFSEGSHVDEAAVAALVTEAVALNVVGN